VQAKMGKALKSRASKLEFVSQNQLKLPGFETPFEQNLNINNRWVLMGQNIPWDRLVNIYESKRLGNFGASRINGRIAIGSLIIKFMNNLSDRNVVLSIQENIYMQYFLGLSSFCPDPLYDPTLLTEVRKRLSVEDMKLINEIIIDHWKNENNEDDTDSDTKMETKDEEDDSIIEDCKTGEESKNENEGSLIVDATACPQDIAYPTDINLLSECREKLELIIDALHIKSDRTKKPRTYREVARKEYLKIAQNRNPSKKAIRKGIKAQLQYVNRDLKLLDEYLDELGLFHLTKTQYKQMLVIRSLYDQQLEMFKEKKHTTADRIVSIHQPHVRPIVRGKRTAKAEFGAKIQIGLSEGLCYSDHLSWDAFNEGQYLEHSVTEFKRRKGHYPKEVLADKIYCTRANRSWLKQKGIILKAKPLGRPSALSNQVRPGERNPVEGKFGQAKTRYGLSRIKARLSSTSATWIAGIIIVLNLVKLAGLSAYCILLSIWMEIIGTGQVSSERKLLAA
jgi:transposase, IS5 family